MGTALNTISVNASIDDEGRIVRWFDKEAAFRVLAGRWWEAHADTQEEIPWELDASVINAPRYRWGDERRSAVKTISADYRGIRVDLQCVGFRMLSMIDIAVDEGDELEELESGLAVIGKRAVIRADWNLPAWSVETAPEGLRLKVPVEGDAAVSVSVADLSSHR